jgi:hypothetical protein
MTTNPVVTHREVKDHIVLRARCHFCDCDNIMTGCSQRPHHGSIAALVREEAHLARLSDRAHFFMSQYVCRIDDRRVYVVVLELGISIQ